MDESKITHWLCVAVSDAIYGLAADRVREIAVLDQVTRTPGAPPWVMGATNLRGLILPLIDLGALLRVRPSPSPATGYDRVSAGSLAAVWEGEVEGIRSPVGLVVDTVSDLVEVPEREIERTPDFGTEVPVDWVLGLARTNESFVLLVDIDRALRSSR